MLKSSFMHNGSVVWNNLQEGLKHCIAYSTSRKHTKYLAKCYILVLCCCMYIYTSMLVCIYLSIYMHICVCVGYHDDVIKWKHFPRNWPFVREIHRSPVNFPHKGQWRGALMFSLIYAWINDWVNNREAGELRRQHGHYDVIVMTVLYMIVTYLFKLDYY